MLAHWFGLLFTSEAPPQPQATSVGGAKDRPKKRPRQSAYFTQHPAEPVAPLVRRDDDEILLLMTLGAL
jgi:hypothetical protein